MAFRLTYATMFNPPEEMHQRFEQALQNDAHAARAHACHVHRRPDVPGTAHEERLSPIDRELSLGMFPLAQPADVEAAFLRPRARRSPDGARPRRSNARECCARAADIMEQRVYEIAAALVLEVGKNRMEALGEAQESVDFFRHYAEDFEKHNGLRRRAAQRSARRRGLAQSQCHAPVRRLGRHRAVQFSAGARGRTCRRGDDHRQHRHREVLDRYALGRSAAGRLRARCRTCRPAYSIICPGSGASVGEALVRDPRTAGITFTGSVAVGRTIMREMAAGAVSAALHHRDGRQEPLHRHRRGRSRPCRWRHRPLRVRHGRPEVLGAVAALCARARRRCAAREDREADGCDPHRRSDRARRTVSVRSSTPMRTRNYRKFAAMLREQGAKFAGADRS